MLFNNIGLGLILKLTDKASVGIQKASRHFKEYSREAMNAAKMTEDAESRMTAALSRYARGFTVGIKLMGLGVGAAAPAVLSMRQFAQSQRTLAEVESLLVSTDLSLEDRRKKMHQLEAAIDKTGISWGVMREELEMAAYPLVSAVGIDPAIEAMERVAILALSGKGTPTAAVDLLTSAYLTFGQKMDPALSQMERFQIITDITAGTIQRYKTDLAQLGAAFTYAGGPAAALGQDLADVFSSLGALQSAGLPGSTAGTAYQAFFRGMSQLQRRLKEMSQSQGVSIDDFIKLAEGGAISDKASKLLANNPLTGLALTDAEGKARPLFDVLKDIQEIFGITTAQEALLLENNAQLIQALQEEGARAAAVLLGRAIELDFVTEQIRESQSATEGADIVNASFSAGIIRMTNALKGASIQIGNALAPAIEAIADSFGEWVAKQRLWLAENPNWAKAIGWISLGTGAILILFGALTLATFGFKTAKEAMVILGSQIKWLYGMTLRAAVGLKSMAVWTWGLATRLKIVAAAQWLWNAALSASPIVWIILGVVALGAAIALLVIYWDEVTTALTVFFTWARELLQKVPDWILIAFAPILLVIKYWPQLKYEMQKFWSWLTNFFDNWKTNWDILTMTVDIYWENLKNKAKAADTFLRGLPLVGPLFSTGMWALDFFSQDPRTVGMQSGAFLRDVFDQIADNVSHGGTRVDYSKAGLATGAGSLGPLGQASGSSVTDYSTHRNNITIQIPPYMSPSELARRVRDELTPKGKM